MDKRYLLGPITLLTAAITLLPAPLPQSGQGKQEQEPKYGEITDDRCGCSHEHAQSTGNCPGKRAKRPDPAKCTRNCVLKCGAKYAFCDRTGVYVIEPQELGAAYAGQKVELKANVVATSINVASIKPVSDKIYYAHVGATFEGTLVDSKCYLKDNSLTGDDHGPVKQCGMLCLKGGTPGALLTKDKKFYAILAPSPALAPYVGQTLRLHGRLHGGAILVEKAEVSRDNRWMDVRLGAMM